MTVDITSDKLALVIHQLGKRRGVSHTAVAEHILRRGLAALRDDILRERAGGTPERAGTIPIRTASDDGEIIIENPCSEQALRRVCGDDWEICWWLATCSIW